MESVVSESLTYWIDWPANFFVSITFLFRWIDWTLRSARSWRSCDGSSWLFWRVEDKAFDFPNICVSSWLKWGGIGEGKKGPYLASFFVFSLTLELQKELEWELSPFSFLFAWHPLQPSNSIILLPFFYFYLMCWLFPLSFPMKKRNDWSGSCPYDSPHCLCWPHQVGARNQNQNPNRHSFHSRPHHTTHKYHQHTSLTQSMFWKVEVEQITRTAQKNKNKRTYKDGKRLLCDLRCLEDCHRGWYQKSL
jgi:hypothetical protein